jgi:hypothetical protein
MNQIEDTLKERGSNYGNFHTFSNLSQSLYAILLKHYNDISKQKGEDGQLPAFMAESLRMICHKLARIANGNPYYADSWVDIGGYSQLVATILEEHEKAQNDAKNAIEQAKNQPQEPSTLRTPTLVADTPTPQDSQ